MSEFDHLDDPQATESVLASATRRGFLMLSLGLLAGCAKNKALVRMPNPPWPTFDFEKPQQRKTSQRPSPYKPKPLEIKPAPTPGWQTSLLSRNKWSRGNPIPTRMSKMAPVKYLTVHHEGMDSFRYSDIRSTASRIEGIRKAHRGRGWGDIGYHFIIDRAGRVWEGRPMRFQGAHVKDKNFANIGVLALGNFDLQKPTQEQLAAVSRYCQQLMIDFRIPISKLRTHQEWAPTACPGRHLQSYMDSARKGGRLS